MTLSQEEFDAQEKRIEDARNLTPDHPRYENKTGNTYQVSGTVSLNIDKEK